MRRYHYERPPGKTLGARLELSRCAAYAGLISIACGGTPPLLAMAWLMHSRRMGWQAALEYVTKHIRHEPFARAVWRCERLPNC